MEWGIKIKSEPATINARVLPTPQVQYHQTSKQQGLLTPQNGVWNLVGQKVCAGAELGSWAVVCFAPQRNMQMSAIETFIKELCNTATDSGVAQQFISLTLDDCSQSQPSNDVCQFPYWGS
jgi:eukaryotic translation initiation factor 2C